MSTTTCQILHINDKIKLHKIIINGKIEGQTLSLEICDEGVGIADVKKAMTPLFTTGGEERAGLGFAVMESFMDKMKVRSNPGKGTSVTLEKSIVSKGK